MENHNNQIQQQLFFYLKYGKFRYLIILFLNFKRFGVKKNTLFLKPEKIFRCYFIFGKSLCSRLTIFSFISKV